MEYFLVAVWVTLGYVAVVVVLPLILFAIVAGIVSWKFRRR